MLGVGDTVAEDAVEVDNIDTTGLLVHESRDTLGATTAGGAADGVPGDALNVVTQDHRVPLSATLTEALDDLAASRHGQRGGGRWWW